MIDGRRVPVIAAIRNSRVEAGSADVDVMPTTGQRLRVMPLRHDFQDRWIVWLLVHGEICLASSSNRLHTGKAAVWEEALRRTIEMSRDLRRSRF